MESSWKIMIATGPLDEDYLIAEIYFQGEEWAELSNFGRVLKLYSKFDGQPWILDPREVIEVIEMAEQKLFGK